MIMFADRFVLEREIGSGGMSRVFVGRDEVLDRTVAIKILKPGYEETDIGARFRREGRTAAKLSHPNIVQVYDAGEGVLDGRKLSYIVMEYVPGGDLKQLIDRWGVLSGGDLVRLSGVAAGLAHAHERGVIHRDIKPHNILLTGSGEVKVADFGIARALDSTHATRTGSYLGTAIYSAPEQLQGQKVTPKTDVYSLGVTLYHAATGRTPFVGTPIEVASQHIAKEPTPPRELNGAVSAPLENLILDCLKKDPEARPTADDVRLGLLEAGRGVHATQAYTEPPVMVRAEQALPPDRPDGPQRGDRPGRGRAILAAVAVVAVLALIGALALPAFLGGGEQAGKNVSGRNGGNQNAPSGGIQNATQQEDGGRRAADGTAAQAVASAGSARAQASAGLMQEAAEQTIVDHYKVAASDNYEDAWNFLSSRYQQEIGAQEAWTDQFRTLESVEFTDGPTAKVDGNTATVSFSTRAVHTNRVDTPTLTATLVREDGEWKIDGLS